VGKEEKWRLFVRSEELGVMVIGKGLDEGVYGEKLHFQ